MKNNALLVVVLIVATLGIAAFFVLRKRGEETNDAKENDFVSDVKNDIPIETPPPPPPPTNNSGGNIQAIPLDPETGDGLLAIVNRIKSYFVSGRAQQVREEQSIGGDFFSVVNVGNASQSQKLRAKLESIALNGRSSQYEIPLLPPIVSSQFVSRLDEIKNYISGIESQISALGRDKVLQRLCDLCNFQGINGMEDFRLLPLTQKEAHDSLINSASTFGTCGGTDNQKKDCYRKNIVKLSNAISQVVAKMQVETLKYQTALKDLAISDLKKSGWLFLGY